MPLRFSYVCQLLSGLEGVVTHDPPYIPKVRDEELKRKTEYWFRCHRRSIDLGEVDGVALLSTLLPEKRIDRVYGFQEPRLCKVLARCLHLNKGSVRLLGAWKRAGHGDLGVCVQRVLKEFDCEQKPGPYVTVEEVDVVLQDLASSSRFSGPDVRLFGDPSSADHRLEQLLKRLNSTEAKWLTRLLLKNFSPVQLDSDLILSEFHFLLPGLLRFQDSFSASVTMLRTHMRHYSSKPDIAVQQAAKAEASRLLTPSVGVKVGRQTFFKARSMQHCVTMCGSQRWSAERKYDGEYCEVHIDLSKGDKSIQIYSKSNKDSTDDRKGIIGILRDCLRIGEPSCAFQSRCIVIGELVVWSEQQQKILDFYHLRKHVSRSGVFLGRDEDSQVRPGEHLMIIFFDILLLDEDMLLQQSYTERRLRLKEVLRCSRGRAMTSERAIIDFRILEDARTQLCYQFAASIAHRCEGLVLKPLDMPYFHFGDDRYGDKRGYVIKLKKDYLQELGELRDVADFAVVGASYDPKLAQKSSVRNLKFTNFYLGCCVNKDSALRFGLLPRFEIVGAITLDQCIPLRELQALNNYATFRSSPVRRSGSLLTAQKHFDLVLTQSPGSKLDHIFTEPCVVEVLGSGFDRPPNKDYQMLRHPRILKVHSDRSWRDTCTLEELQKLAGNARNAPIEGESQEMLQLVKQLQGKFMRKAKRDEASQKSTQRTESTVDLQTIGSAPQTRSSKPPLSRPRRKPSKVRMSPILIRIDTSERIPGEPDLGSSQRSAQQDPQPLLTDSLPTPTTSSGTGSPSISSAQKRKAQSIDTVRAVKYVKRSDKSKDLELLPSALLSVNSNIITRRSATFNEPAQSPRLFPGAPSATRRMDELLSCCNLVCPFSESIAFLSPCVSGFPWVSDSLLRWHGIERVTELRHWSRATKDVKSSCIEVSESLSFPAYQKLVFVESHRLEATLQCVDAVKRLEIRDLVLFYDWRVLEEWKDAEGVESQNAQVPSLMHVLEKRYFGFTCWSADQEKMVFMHKDLVKMPKQWLEH